MPKETPAVFHNGSTYDYHFIIKELAKEFEGNFECLGENTEKYITFSLSKLVDNLSEGIHNNKCSGCESSLDYIKIKKNGKLIWKCFNCNIYYKKNLIKIE